nr:unnamed protein product [Spirometra erinaceieuropaei]
MKSSLKNSHKEVFQPDYTPTERLKRRELVTELKRRPADGESNLDIFREGVVEEEEEEEEAERKKAEVEDREEEEEEEHKRREKEHEEGGEIEKEGEGEEEEEEGEEEGGEEEEDSADQSPRVLTGAHHQSQMKTRDSTESQTNLRRNDLLELKNFSHSNWQASRRSMCLMTDLWKVTPPALRVKCGHPVAQHYHVV